MDSPAITCRRDDFSLPPDVHYLNCAYMSPLPKRVEEKGIGGIRAKRDPSKIFPEHFFKTSEAVRAAFSRLIGASRPERISLAPAVSYGVASVAANIDVSPGNEIVVLHEQFPSHIYSWRRLATERSASIRTIHPPDNVPDRGKAWNERILEAIGGRTAAVCIPTVHWTDGTRFDLRAIGERAREVDALLIVDATQSLGAVPLDLSEIKPDCLVSAGYKWLMGPYSTAFVYWSDRFDNGRPLEENWISREASDDFAGLVAYRDDYQAGALRYDVGERSNFILMPMMLEALTYIDSLNPARISEYCRTLTAGFFDSAKEIGFQIEDDAFRSDHLFGIRVPKGIELDALKRALSERQVSVSVRGSAIRVAPNVYNDKRDIGRLAEALEACAAHSVR